MKARTIPMYKYSEATARCTYLELISNHPQYAPNYSPTLDGIAVLWLPPTLRKV